VLRVITARVLNCLSLPSMGAAAEVFLSVPSVLISRLVVARSQRARERSIRLFIQRFIVVNLPTYFSMSRYPKLLASSTDTSFFLRTCCANPSPSASYRGFPASAYLLTRNQQSKRAVSPWRIWTNTTRPIRPPDIPVSPIVFRHTISLPKDSKIESAIGVKIDTTIGSKTLC